MAPHWVTLECVVTMEWNSLKRFQGLEDMALLEEVSHWREALRFQKPMLGPVVLNYFFSTMPAMPAVMLPTMKIMD